MDNDNDNDNDNDMPLRNHIYNIHIHFISIQYLIEIKSIRQIANSKCLSFGKLKYLLRLFMYPLLSFEIHYLINVITINILGLGILYKNRIFKNAVSLEYI